MHNALQIIPEFDSKDVLRYTTAREAVMNGSIEEFAFALFDTFFASGNPATSVLEEDFVLTRVRKAKVRFRRVVHRRVNLDDGRVNTMSHK